jgi:hypothetical protein
MADLMAQGANGIRQQAEAADKLSTQQIDAAKRLDDAFNKTWTNFLTGAKRAAVAVAEIVGQLATTPGTFGARFGSATSDIADSSSTSGKLMRGLNKRAESIRTGLGTIDAATEKAIAQKRISDAQPFVGLFGAPPTAAEVAKRNEQRLVIIAANDNNPTRSEDDRGRYRCAA